MRLATVLTPITDEHLQWAAQCGVTELVVRYPDIQSQGLSGLQQHVARFGLTIPVVEGYLPIERLKLGTDDGTDLVSLKTLLKQMGDAGVGVLCYNFMAGTDWVRTQVDAPERGGARVTAFRLADVERAVSLESDGSVLTEQRVTAEALWERLERLLHELLPVAERAGVTLAMHPDDPPLPALLGRARIMNSVENFERLMQLAPSAHNGICFCQGSFATMNVDIPATIRRLGPYIKYVHFRDVVGNPAEFRETFHDNGPTDMVAAMRAYRAIGFAGTLRPDHVPQYAGEAGEPGYTMLGRLFAFGYMRGLMQATEGCAEGV